MFSFAQNGKSVVRPAFPNLRLLRMMAWPHWVELLTQTGLLAAQFSRSFRPDPYRDAVLTVATCRLGRRRSFPTDPR